MDKAEEIKSKLNYYTEKTIDPKFLGERVIPESNFDALIEDLQQNTDEQRMEDYKRGWDDGSQWVRDHQVKSKQQNNG